MRQIQNRVAFEANLFHTNPRNLEVEQNTNLRNRVGQIASDVTLFFFSVSIALWH